MNDDYKTFKCGIEKSCDFVSEKGLSKVTTHII